jgi:hypothetical protein
MYGNDLINDKKLHFLSNEQDFDRIINLYRIFENKTDVGSGDNIIQLIKAHSLHTLFAVFGKNRNFQKIWCKW